MPARHAPLPRLWLVTDERMGEALWAALARLPRGSGIVFRHLATPEPVRSALLTRVRTAARRGGILVIEAGRDFGPPDRPRLAVHVHSLPELRAARRTGARLLFLSPVFPTRTHPGAPGLGVMRFAALAARAPAPVIALGGMTRARFRRLAPLGAYGWAAIDGLTPPRTRQKRKAVPR